MVFQKYINVVALVESFCGTIFDSLGIFVGTALVWNMASQFVFPAYNDLPKIYHHNNNRKADQKKQFLSLGTFKILFSVEAFCILSSPSLGIIYGKIIAITIHKDRLILTSIF